MIITIGLFRPDIAEASPGYLEMTFFIEHPDFRWIGKSRPLLVKVDGPPVLGEKIYNFVRNYCIFILT
jgi:hypothetical protein